MNYREYLDISPEVQAALDAKQPIVALESTIISHGMPYPQNLEFAKQVEDVVRNEGAVPATMAIIGGRLKVGVGPKELEALSDHTKVEKVSRRDIAAILASGKTGATTVATTMIISALAGIRVFATGGIGGVHRGAPETFDISADLQELAHTDVAVVCAGAKSLLDIGLTLEYLETMGVPVVGMRTDEFPAFYCKESGFGVDVRYDSEADLAKMLKIKWDLGIHGGAIVGNPVPDAYALDSGEMNKVIDDALKEAAEKGIKGKETTPFLLAKIVELTEGVSLKTNIQLAFNNAKVAAKLAVELNKLED